MSIKVEYYGKWPDLCSGRLIVTVDEKVWEFPSYCLSSGGHVSFNAEWEEDVGEGPWSINEWPEGFPEELKAEVEEEVNSTVPYGCCGGCV